MSVRDDLSALEGLMRSAGWKLIEAEMAHQQDAAERALAKIETPEGAASAPMWAAQARLARTLRGWPAERVGILTDKLNEGERHG